MRGGAGRRGQGFRDSSLRPNGLAEEVPGAGEQPWLMHPNRGGWQPGAAGVARAGLGAPPPLVPTRGPAERVLAERDSWQRMHGEAAAKASAHEAVAIELAGQKAALAAENAALKAQLQEALLDLQGRGAQRTGEDAAAAAGRLTAELEGMRPSALRKRAVAAGVQLAQLEAAEDGEGPRDAIVALILAHAPSAAATAAQSAHPPPRNETAMQG